MSCEVGTCNDGACSYELDPSATTTPVFIQIKTDEYPGETSWDISYDNKVIYSGSGYNAPFTVYNDNHDLCEGTYKYCISDAYGDGICCSNGDGYYTVTVNDNVVATGGDFGYSDCTDFTVSTGPTAPTPTAPSPVAVPTTPTVPPPVAAPIDDCNSESDCERMSCEVGTCNDGACSYELDQSAFITPVSIQIKTDEYPGETSWDIFYDDKVIYSGSGYNAPFTVYNHNHDLCDGTYEYCISDAYGDGNYCSFGEGYYTVTVNDNIVAEGGDFGYFECTDFTVSSCTSDNDCERMSCEVGTCNDGVCSYELDPSATTTPVSIQIKTDFYPGETSWTLSYDNEVIYSFLGYNELSTVYNHNHDLCDGTYEYCISDGYGDGICCSPGDGYYTVTVNDKVVATGGDFGDSDCTDFTVSTGDTGPTPTAPSPVAAPTKKKTKTKRTRD